MLDGFLLKKMSAFDIDWEYRSLQLGNEGYGNNFEFTKLTKLTSLVLVGEGDLEPVLESMKELQTLSFNIDHPVLPVSGLSKLESLRVNLLWEVVSCSCSHQWYDILDLHLAK